jgi:hypothetical protein
MHPTVRHADLVLVAPVGREVRRRDVVLVPLGPRLMLHRVVRVEDATVHTRGDARQRDDAPIPRNAVIARALAVRSKAGLTPLILTMRFGAGPLVRFLLGEARRRARLARAAIHHTFGKRREG